MPVFCLREMPRPSASSFLKFLSRFGRDYLVVGNYISRVFPFLGVRFIAVNDGFDSSRPQDIDSLDTSFKTLIYDLYSRELSTKVKNAKRMRAEKGLFLSPFAPYGYVKDPENKNRLLIDEEAAVIVRKIFALTIDGAKPSEIAALLNREGVPTPMLYKRAAGCSRERWPSIHEENFWTQGNIFKILRDERYIGKCVYGKRERDAVGNRHTVKRSKTDWVIVDETHEGIVSKTDFQKAAGRMKEYREFIPCTDKIMSNTAWTMAGIFADKGITGTSAKKREDFMRMIRHCRQKKIDVILTKSVSRFSRNTVDCLYYIRALKQLGIAVIFEKENINSLEEDSELRITLSGAFAQSESESISANVTWGKRRAMEAGKVSIQYKKLYGYRKGEDGQPEIIPEQAEIVRWLYERYLTGASLRMIKDELEQQGVKCFEDSPEWTISRIRSILQNEKYCGDVLMQKTFRQDFINRKAIKNTGQLPMYLIENHHEGIVSREKYDAVQAEMARRNAAKSPSKNAVTGMASYASKYALSERLVCGECGTLYRRCTWTRNGEKRVVWRCVSRLDYGKKYCHNSPTLDEAPLQQAILAALNTAMADKNSLIRQITAAMETELIPFPGGTMSLGDIECRLRVLEQQFQTLLEKATDDPAAYGGQFKEILDEQTFLKEKRSVILANNNEQAKANQRIMDAAQTLENASPYITEWDESAVRQLVETVKILSKDEVAVTLKGGIEICQKIMY